MTRASEGASAATSRPSTLPDAVGTGLASVVGAGIFVALAPAAMAAGDQLLPAVLLAAAVVALNAASAARLAVSSRAPLGTHVHGRDRLGVAWGHLSGWAFVVGAVSAAAALALTLGMHLLPGFPKVVAVAAVLGALGLHLQGITRSTRGEGVLAALAVVVLLVFVVSLLATPPVLADGPPSAPEGSGGVTGVVQAAGFVVFALTGSVRLLNQRTRGGALDRTVPRALTVSLGIVITTTLLVAFGLSRTLGTGWVAARQLPVVEAAEISAWPWLGPVLQVAAVLTAGGVLLGLVLTTSGTVAAMARDRHLPVALAVREGPHLLPRRALVVVAAFVVVSIVLVDVRQAMAFASFCVLVHFALLHASAWTLDPRWSRRVVPALGLVGCLGVAALLPWQSVVAGVLVLLLGAVIGWVRHATRE